MASACVAFLQVIHLGGCSAAPVAGVAVPGQDDAPKLAPARAVYVHSCAPSCCQCAFQVVRLASLCRACLRRCASAGAIRYRGLCLRAQLRCALLRVSLTVIGGWLLWCPPHL